MTSNCNYQKFDSGFFPRSYLKIVYSLPLPLVNGKIVYSLPLTLVNGMIDKTSGFSLNIRLNNSAKARASLFISPLTKVNGNELMAFNQISTAFNNINNISYLKSHIF